MPLYQIVLRTYNFKLDCDILSNNLLYVLKYNRKS